jgi:peroxiredoxin
MARTESTMLALGTTVPDFTLPDVVNGKTVALSALKSSKALLIFFICPHCPFVVHVEKELSALGNEYTAQGVAVVAICSNDVVQFPQDGPEGMREQATRLGFRFPYLHDDSQAVAHAFKAACTPDIFLFDGTQKLVYRGQLDGSRPGNDVPVTGTDLRTALDAVLAGKPVAEDQRASLGCNIKWK